MLLGLPTRKEGETMITVLNIVREYLVVAGYDGLWNPDGECACLRDDLAPCGEMSEECRPGRLAPAQNHDDSGWRIVSETVSAHCRRTHFQDCDNCDDTECGDNTRKVPK